MGQCSIKKKLDRQPITKKRSDDLFYELASFYHSSTLVLYQVVQSKKLGREFWEDERRLLWLDQVPECEAKWEKSKHIAECTARKNRKNQLRSGTYSVRSMIEKEIKLHETLVNTYKKYRWTKERHKFDIFRTRTFICECLVGVQEVIRSVFPLQLLYILFRIERIINLCFFDAPKERKYFLSLHHQLVVRCGAAREYYKLFCSRLSVDLFPTCLPREIVELILSYDLLENDEENDQLILNRLLKMAK